MIMQDLDDAAVTYHGSSWRDGVTVIYFIFIFLLYEATWCTWFVLIQS